MHACSPRSNGLLAYVKTRFGWFPICRRKTSSAVELRGTAIGRRFFDWPASTQACPLFRLTCDHSSFSTLASRRRQQRDVALMHRQFTQQGFRLRDRDRAFSTGRFLEQLHFGRLVDPLPIVTRANQDGSNDGEIAIDRRLFTRLSRSVLIRSTKIEGW
jgi:hypothetical protein